MNAKPTNLDPKLLALPTVGMKEYVIFANRYCDIKEVYNKKIEILQKLQVLDTANDYSGQIAQTFGDAFINDMEWEIERRRILAKYLRNEYCSRWNFFF